MKIVKVSSANEATVLLNLMQGYEAEFSAITQKTPQPDGLFALDTPLDDEHEAFLYLETNDTPIGFCIIGKVENRHDVSEFYIVPSKRSKKAGRDLACAIFDMYSGEWQVRQIAGADKAYDFWNKTISYYTNGQYTNSTLNDPYWGFVRIQHFTSKRTQQKTA